MAEAFISTIVEQLGSSIATYDIFLSFRGPDTRKTFTSHLYENFTRAGFHTFRDDDELDVGDKIAAGLERAIQESKISVVVFSKDYASSRWCLDELVTILKKVSHGDHTLISIFYDVTPSQVGKQSGSFASSFDKHEEQFHTDKINEWRAALKHATDLKGMELKDRHESDFIQDVVREIRNILPPGKLDLQRLQNSMVSIQAVINDAEKRQLTEETVRVWVDKLKVVAYDIDDVLDEWSTAILKAKIDRVENPSSNVGSIIREHCIRFNIAGKIKDLNERLDVIAEEKNKYSFQSSTLSTISPSSQSSTLKNRESVSFVDVRDIVGRVDDKKSLIDMLLSESSHTSNVSIISIIGMGGLGKTTLAQFAYNDNTIHTHFEKRMWVCVSDPFEETRVAKAILEELRVSTRDLNGLNSLLKEISDHMQGKRFFLVLDDVWCDEYDWCQKLQDCLKVGCLPGSKILITTRKEGVATAVGSTKFPLGALGDEESLELFKCVTFRNWNVEERELVEDVGDKIVKKCKGFPLALKAVGGYLCEQKYRQVWLNVLEREKWKVAEEKGVFPLLLLSYNDLPPPIRQCFLYCAVFPKDYKIEKDYIINLWMAQGYLGVDNSIEMEEVGDDYFSELARRSFFQDFKKDVSGMIISCKMHDIVHDFARSLTKNECLAMEVNGVGEPNLETSSYANACHLMMMFGSCEVSIPISLGNLKSLHTLIFCHCRYASFDESFDQVLGQLTNLRTLDLSYTPIQKLSKKVGKLLRLRYLNLEGCAKLQELPDAIWDLCNLLILDIRRCPSLIRLPNGLGKVINLRKLLVWSLILPHISVPRGVDKLTCIRHLDEFVVVRSDSNSNEASTLSDLMKLNQLRSLTIRGLACVREVSEARKAKLNEKEHLTKLTLIYYLNDYIEEEEVEVRSREREVINALQPHHNLTSLVLKFTPWPDWMTPSSMKHLKHLSFTGDCEVLPGLGNFPFLESLEICCQRGLKTVGLEFLGTTTSFPRLKKLKFIGMEEWEDWNIFNLPMLLHVVEGMFKNTTTSIITTMPCLQDLEIIDCPKLKRLPDDILNKVPSLQRFYIKSCPKLKEYMIQHFPRDTRPSCLIMLD